MIYIYYEYSSSLKPKSSIIFSSLKYNIALRYRFRAVIRFMFF